MVDIFESPKRMLNRGEHHIADLAAKINSFVQDKPWSRVIEADVDGVTELHKIKFTERLSEDIPHIVFDAANNLRSALDQAAFQIGVHHTGTAAPKSAKFPMGPTEGDMLNAVRICHRKSKRFFAGSCLTREGMTRSGH